jgi:hypothetical protein
MSLVESFVRGHRHAALVHAWATKGTVEGRGLLNCSVKVTEATPEALAAEGGSDWGYMLRHAVSELDVKKALLRHVAASGNTDESLISEVDIKSCRMFHAPIYVYVCSSETEWSAAFGYDHTEYYTDHERFYRDGRWQTKDVTRSNIVTDWHPQRGTADNEFVEVGYGGRSLPAHVVDLIELTDPAGMEPVFAHQLGGMDVDPHTEHPENVFHQTTQDRALEEVAYGVHDCLQGDRVRDCQWSTWIEAGCVKALVPVCHLSFTIRGHSYDFYAHGRDLSKYVCDPLPAASADDKAKLKRTPMLYVLMALIAAAIGTKESTGFGIVAWLALAGGLLIYLAARRSGRISRLRSQRRDTLQRRLAELDSTGTSAARAFDDTDEEEETRADRFEWKYLPGLLILAVGFTIFRSHSVDSAPSKLEAAPVKSAPPQAVMARAPQPQPAAVVAAMPESPPPIAEPETVQPEAVASADATHIASASDLASAGGSVLDTFNLLSPKDRARLEADFEAFRLKTGRTIGFHSVTTTGQEKITAFTDRVGNEWAIKRGDSTTAVFIVIAPQNPEELGRLHISVASNVVDRLTDAETAAVITDKMGPRFRKGEVYEALRDAAESFANEIGAP